MPRVGAQDRHHRLRVGAGADGGAADLVGERHLERVPAIVGELGEFGHLERHLEQRGRGAVIEPGRTPRRPRPALAEDDAGGALEVGDGTALAQELRVHRHLVAPARVLAGSRGEQRQHDLLGGAGRHGAAQEDDERRRCGRPAGQGGSERFRHRAHGPELEPAVRPCRRRDADRGEVGAVQGAARLGGGGEPPGRGGLAQASLEPGLAHRGPTRRHRRDRSRVRVDAVHAVPGRGEAARHGGADMAEAIEDNAQAAIPCSQDGGRAIGAGRGARPALSAAGRGAPRQCSTSNIGPRPSRVAAQQP